MVCGVALTPVSRFESPVGKPVRLRFIDSFRLYIGTSMLGSHAISLLFKQVLEEGTIDILANGRLKVAVSTITRVTDECLDRN